LSDGTALARVNVSRRTLLVAAVALVAAFAWWLWPSRDATFRNFPPRANGPWAAFGDSLTEGYGASSDGSYPAQLSRKLGVAIQNHGVSGETSADGLKRLEAIAAAEPRVVLLCFGGNDVLRGIPADVMFENLRGMIDRFHAAGSFVVLIGVRGKGLRDANAEGFARLAEEKEVLLVPNILEGLLTQPSLMSDYVHPNEAGYSRIAERIETLLRPLLPTLAPMSP
jgi:acyl-CoA thioesterase I